MSRLGAHTGGGLWRPATLTPGDIVALQLLLLVALVTRSLDYATGDNDRVAGLIERALPLPVWSVACLGVAVMLALGMTARRHLLVFVGHGLAASIYAALAAGTFLNALNVPLPPAPPDAVEPHAPAAAWWVALVLLAALPAAAAVGQRIKYRQRPRRTWWVSLVAGGLASGAAGATLVDLDGVRSVMPLVVVAGLHGLLCYRSGPRPIGPEDVTIEGTVVAPTTQE